MRYIWLICLFFVAHFLKAQEELSLFFHPDVIQSGQLQPAYAPQGTFNIGFGSTYFHLDARGPRILSSSGTINYLRDLAGGITQNYLSSDASFNAFDLGFVKDGWYIRAGYQMHSNGYFNFDQTWQNFLLLAMQTKLAKQLSLVRRFILDRQVKLL